MRSARLHLPSPAVSHRRRCRGRVQPRARDSVSPAYTLRTSAGRCERHPAEPRRAAAPPAPATAPSAPPAAHRSPARTPARRAASSASAIDMPVKSGTSCRARASRARRSTTALVASPASLRRPSIVGGGATLAALLARPSAPAGGSGSRRRHAQPAQRVDHHLLPDRPGHHRAVVRALRLVDHHEQHQPRRSSAARSRRTTTPTCPSSSAASPDRPSAPCRSCRRTCSPAPTASRAVPPFCVTACSMRAHASPPALASITRRASTCASCTVCPSGRRTRRMHVRPIASVPPLAIAA